MSGPVGLLAQRRGYIGLQAEYHEITFRSIKLKPLE
jgi:hypothetical protein